jgi:hypothetical protein
VHSVKTLHALREKTSVHSMKKNSMHSMKKNSMRSVKKNSMRSVKTLHALREKSPCTL